MNGIIGGAIAGILKNIPNAILHNWLKLTELSFWDYSAAVAFFRHPSNFGEQLYVFTYEIFFCVLLGIIYIYLNEKIRTEHYLIKGAIYGMLIWFLVHTVILAYQIQQLIKTDLATSLVNSLCSIVYGLLLAWIIHYLEEKRQRIEG